MLTVLFAVAAFFGLARLITFACEREMLRSDREEKPQKITRFSPQDGFGQRPSHTNSLTTNFEENSPTAASRPNRKRTKTSHQVPSENDEVAA
jgi:hypothetical protein